MSKVPQFIQEFWAYKDLLKLLVSRNIKLKYRRSFLGYVWSVLNPLLIMIVMTIVFSTMFNRNIENFPVYLFCGQLLFNFMNTSTHQAIFANTGNRHFPQTHKCGQTYQITGISLQYMTSAKSRLKPG